MAALLEGGILGQIKKRKQRRKTEAFKDDFLERLKNAGAKESTLEILGTIKADSPESLLSTIQNVQSIIKNTSSKPSEGESVRDRIRASIKIAETFTDDDFTKKIKDISSEIKTEKGADIIEKLISKRLESLSSVEVKNLKDKNEFKPISKNIESLVRLFGNARAQIEQQSAFDLTNLGVTTLRGFLPGQQAPETNLGISASIKAKSGDARFSAVDAFNRRKEAVVTQIARAAGEQRISDKDAERFLNALMDLGAPDETNIRLIGELQRELEAKGFNANFSETLSKLSPSTSLDEETINQLASEGL